MRPSGAGSCGWSPRPVRPAGSARLSARAPTSRLLDLEHSVPAGGKDRARAAAVGRLARDGENTGREAAVLGVRVNAPCTLPGVKDLVALAEHGLRPTVLLVPKVESARDVELVAQITGGDGEQRRVWALIETPRGIRNLDAILASDALAGVAFGAADYAAAGGGARSSRALWYPRSVLATGAAAGLPALDSPGFDLTGGAELRAEAEEAAEPGFTGKVAVHPRQIPVIREAFRPSAAVLAQARAVIAAAGARGGGVTEVGGQMVGPPLVAAARALTARAAPIPSVSGGAS
ncbi:aldolase/citrate lyase family protein [Streptomyces jumonjinensis]|uniref:aldolase/citrate lyase family protein n=1 Tax=Streptomyces jumonjinensis TaxID=1945 RepID=UPI00379E5F5A